MDRSPAQPQFKTNRDILAALLRTDIECAPIAPEDLQESVRTLIRAIAFEPYSKHLYKLEAALPKSSMRNNR